MKIDNTLYCDICRSKKDWSHDGKIQCKVTRLCVACQKRILAFVALESGGAFDWRPQ